MPAKTTFFRAALLLLLTALYGSAAFDTQHFPYQEPDNFAKLRNAPTVKAAFSVKSAGNYRLFFAYEQPTNRLANLQVRVCRADTGETLRFALLEFQSAYPAKKPAPVQRPAQTVWASVAIDFEYPVDINVLIDSAYGSLNPQNHKYWGFRAPRPRIGAVWLSNDPHFNPAEAGPEDATELAVQAPPVPEGLHPATPHAPSASLNSGIDPRRRLQLTMMECYPFYLDFAALLQLGANMNYGNVSPLHGLEQYDALDTGKPDFTARELERIYPMPPKDDTRPGGYASIPVGRSANSRGQYQRSFSYSFEPYRQMCYSNAVESLKKTIASEENKAIVNWFSAWEQCGDYDYGETSVNAFRTWLEARYGSLEALNRAWRTEYTGFSEIVPAKWADCVGKNKRTNRLELARAKANFIDFRDFNSKAYASWLALKTKAIQETDPERRDMTSAYSNNNLGSIMWLRWRPVSFEDSMQITLKGSRTMGWDIYGSDDLVASSFEHWFSFSDGKTWPMIKEGSTHSPDPRLAVRSLWPLFGEGMKGMSLFTMQETSKPELRKFGMQNCDDDMAPRPKLAAYSDMFRALQHVENFFSEAERQPVGKPVALYYSQTCNLMQERGYGSIFDSAPDTLFRVFELIRANGYPCTVITDRQILETDFLDSLSAVFFLDAQYIPLPVIDKLEAWVRKGGHIVCDGQTGAYDGHGFPSTRMIDLLGIKPVLKQRIDESAAETLAFGYSSQAFEVINMDELWQTQMEYLHQRDSQHPIVQKAGKVMFSGFGFQDVRSVEGETIILHNNGGVGWHIRSLGKGTASYFAGYLGTLYGGGATQYEWRDSHSDDSPYRWFDALLSFFGAARNGETDLENPYDLRISTPLRSPSGNLFSALTSYANHTLPPFRVRTFLPKGAKAPEQILMIRDGSREVVPVDFTYDAGRNAVVCNLPGFRVFAGLLYICENTEPIVSVSLPEARRDAAGLADVRPGEALTAQVRVFNPSGKKLPEGELELRLPEGWFCSAEKWTVPAIAAHSCSEPIPVTIRTPDFCTARRLRPVNFIYRSKKTVSLPAVEMVWFQKEPQLHSSF